MFEGADTVVLYDELAYEDLLPVQWQPLPRPLERFALIGLEESNALLLQACIAVEEHPVRETSEQLEPRAAELARMEFKLNLVLQLLSKLVAQAPMPAPTEIQFNALGASWLSLEPPPATGALGLLRVQLRSSLPQPLELPAEVSSTSGNRVRVMFPELSEGTVELIQRLAFLRHRRHVADARKARHP
jgi:hypothetical protein